MCNGLIPSGCVIFKIRKRFICPFPIAKLQCLCCININVYTCVGSLALENVTAADTGWL